MEQNNSKLPLDLTEVANKTYDDLASKPLKSTGNAGSTIIDFLHNFILYPLQKYNIYATNKLKKYEEEVINRTNKIPKENLTFPRVNIFGPTFDGLKYNLDEQHIKEMFTNVLISEMDNRKQNKVLPAYIEIVKQLNQEDALFLTTLKEKKLVNNIPIIRLKLVKNINSTFGYISPYFICLTNGDYIEIPQLVLDNLIRLQIVEIPFDEYLADKTIYEDTFNKLKVSLEFSLFTTIPNNHLDFQKCELNFTNFGRNFIDICLS